MATEAELKALSNAQLQSSIEITAVRHRTVNDALIDEMFLAQSRGDVLAGVQAAAAIAAADKVLVIRGGQAYLLDADEFGFISNLVDLSDVNITSPSDKQIVNYDFATSKFIASDAATLINGLFAKITNEALGTNPTAANANTADIFNITASAFTADTTLTLSNVTLLSMLTMELTNTNANVITFAGVTLDFGSALPTGVTFAANALTFPNDSAVKYLLKSLSFDGTTFYCILINMSIGISGGGGGGTAATTSLDPASLPISPVTNLQAYANSNDAAVLKARGTGVTTSYVSSVTVGGTTFSQPAVLGEINSDQGYFSISGAGAVGVTVGNLTAPNTFVYYDHAGTLSQQTSEPTREDFTRKMFTMRIAVDTVAETIIGFEYLNNPIGHYANSIRDTYSFLLAQNVPFKKDQIVTGRAADLGFDISAGSLFEFGGTGDIYNPNIKDFALVNNAPFFLSTRTAFDAGGNTNLPKFWDNATTITPLGSTTVVGHRLYRFSNGNLALQYGQGNYANIVLARAGVLLEDYVLNPALKNATFFGWWLIQETATNTGGTTLTDFREYTIGLQGGSSSGLSGCLLRGNNLSDLLDVDAAAINLELFLEVALGTNATALNALSVIEVMAEGTYTANATLTLSNVTNLRKISIGITNTNANVITFAGITVYFKPTQLPTGVTFATNALTFPADSAVLYNIVLIKYHASSTFSGFIETAVE
jgi:hypothetical protein